MRLLALSVLMAGLLSGCAGFLDVCIDGLRPPPASDRVPSPHG
jgi:hypothetical protein